MEIYRSEDEQVEALRQWWKKNGTQLIILLVVALASVFGWQTWQQQQANESALLSDQYTLMLLHIERSEPARAEEIARSLLAEAPRSLYAAAAALLLARMAVESGDLTQSEAHLRWVMTQKASPELLLLARVRLARLLLASDRLDEAMAQVAKGSEAAVAEVRGEIALRQGDLAAARTAFELARDGYANQPDKRRWLEMRLDDLPAGTP
jgi:predicted negative regulator of RcsB-dependent stress response